MTQNNSKQTRQEIINETLERMNRGIETLKSIINTEGYVVVSEFHIAINSEGLNGTGFGLKNAGGCKDARIFKTEEEAQKGIDPYLLDMYNKPIEQKVRKASEVFEEELKSAQELMETMKGMLS